MLTAARHEALNGPAKNALNNNRCSSIPAGSHPSPSRREGSRKETRNCRRSVRNDNLWAVPLRYYIRLSYRSDTLSFVIVLQ